MSDTKPTILFIDDEENILNSMRRLFSNTNYRILTAINGKEGLEILKKEKVNVIVTDQKMPEMKGVEVLKRAKSISPDTTRIILTAYSDRNQVVEIISKIKIFKYLKKPWKNEDLLKIVTDAVDLSLKKKIEKKPENDPNKQEKITETHKENNSREIMTKGKKIFFLFPHTLLEKAIKDIISNGFEAYLIDDYNMIKKILKKYNDSILFINIDIILKESEWEKYIKSIRNNPETHNVKIGILTYYGTKELSRKYIMDIGIQCGFIKLTPDLAKSKQIILRILESNEIKGRRNHIRVVCNKKLDTFNFVYNTMKINGYIHDMSIIGMACSFYERIDLLPKTPLYNIQLILRGTRCLVSGIVAAVRGQNDTNPIYIILFNLKTMRLEVENKIFGFIYNRLQEDMNKEIEELKNN